MIWNPSKECLSRKEYEEIKLERLQWTVKRAYENVQFYRDRFDKIGLKPEHIKTLKDIEKIPYTSKLDLRENYPFKLFAEPCSAQCSATSVRSHTTLWKARINGPHRCLLFSLL